MITSCEFQTASGENDGSGAETTNGIVGVINDEAGGAEGVTVSLFPREYNPVTDEIPENMKAVTDKEGRYSFDIDVPGVYNIEVVRGEDELTALVQGIDFPGDKDTVITAADARLTEAGSITVQLQELSAENSGYIYIPGTSFHNFVSDNHITAGSILLPGVATSTYSKIIYSTPENAGEISLLSDEITVQAATHVILNQFAAWDSSARININASVSGIQQDVMSFPLLLRLGSESSLFENAAVGGRDIRFLKSDNVTELAYEIELWDPSGQGAVLWVLLDTVFAKSSDQFITMHWGRKGAQSSASSHDVFVMENNYAAVWHLGESLADATSNGNDGTNFNTSSAGGIIGECRDFNGIDNYISFGNDATLNPTTAITVEAWIKSEINVDTLIVRDLNVIRHARNYTALQLGSESEGAQSVRWVTTETDSAGHKPYDTGPFSWSTLNDGNWHYFVSSYHTTRGMKIYVDGVEVASAGLTGDLVPALEDFLLGTRLWGLIPADRIYYTGQMDEVRVSNNMRDADWIKLSYENQKSGSTVVQID